MNINGIEGVQESAATFDARSVVEVIGLEDDAVLRVDNCQLRSLEARRGAGKPYLLSLKN
jgi:hypothetical protein